MSYTEKLHGGVFALLGGYLLKAIYLLPMLFIWRSLAAGGAN
jgi:hypothetical protein